MWGYHWDLVVSFVSSSLSEWTLTLNTWKNTGEPEEESLKSSTESDHRTEAMVFDEPNPEEVGTEYRLEVYEKVWGSSASQIYITIHHTFRVGALIDYLIL